MSESATAAPRRKKKMVIAIITASLLLGPPSALVVGTATADRDRDHGSNGYDGNGRSGPQRGPGYHHDFDPKNGYHLHWSSDRPNSSGATRAENDRDGGGGDSDWYVCRRHATWCANGR